MHHDEQISVATPHLQKLCEAHQAMLIKACERNSWPDDGFVEFICRTGFNFDGLGDVNLFRRWHDLGRCAEDFPQRYALNHLELRVENTCVSSGWDFSGNFVHAQNPFRLA